MKKWRSNAGETLPETLVALLIVVLTFLFLTGAVISAAKTNNALKNGTMSSRDALTDDSFSVTVNGKAITGAKQYAITMQDGYKYYYYE